MFWLMTHPVIDAQAHLYRANTPAEPWPSDPWRPTPAVSAFTGEQMLEAMDDAGVDRAVIVPPIWQHDDQRASFETAAQAPDRFKIMGRFDPYGPDAATRIHGWLEQPNMVGMRLAFLKWNDGGVLVGDVLDDRSLDWFWAECETQGVPIACLTQASVAGLGPIAARHPRLRLIVDHLASVAGDTVGESFRALDDLLALAELPNVYVKVSDAPNRSKEPYPFRDVHDVVARVRDAFGAQRMMWAVDITQIGDLRYLDCLRLWQEGIPFLSDEEREWILGGTAAEVLSWPA